MFFFHYICIQDWEHSKSQTATKQSEKQAV